MARDPMAINNKMKNALKAVNKAKNLPKDDMDSRTMFALHRRGYIKGTGKNWQLTAAGKKVLK